MYYIYLFSISLVIIIVLLDLPCLNNKLSNDFVILYLVYFILSL